MKQKGLIILAAFMSCFLCTNGVRAETVGYIDSVENPVTDSGVVGAEFTGSDGAAIFGHGTSTTGHVYGGYFRSNSDMGQAVFGYASSDSGHTCGGYFVSDGDYGKAVYGIARGATGVNYGGYFKSYSESSKAVYGIALSKSGYSIGGSFRSLSNRGKGVYGLAAAPTGPTYGGYFSSMSNTGKGVAGVASATTGVNFGVYGETSSATGYGVYSKGNMMVEGNQIVTGEKSAVVQLKNGKRVLMYAVEASENWFEDFGSSRLTEGSVCVNIEPTFAETVNTDMEYHVFLTPKGDCRGLYVTNETASSFEVRELDGGKSNIAFSYRIVAKRRGYEDQRLATVNEDETAAIVATQLETMEKDAAMELASHME